MILWFRRRNGGVAHVSDVVKNNFAHARCTWKEPQAHHKRVSPDFRRVDEALAHCTGSRSTRAQIEEERYVGFSYVAQASVLSLTSGSDWPTENSSSQSSRTHR